MVTKPMDTLNNHLYVWCTRDLSPHTSPSRRDMAMDIQIQAASVTTQHSDIHNLHSWTKVNVTPTKNSIFFVATSN